MLKHRNLYSGDLNSILVWYSNGPKQFAPWMVCNSGHGLNSKLKVCYSRHDLNNELIVWSSHDGIYPSYLAITVHNMWLLWFRWDTIYLFIVLRPGPIMGAVTASRSVQSVYGLYIPFYQRPHLWLGRGGDWTRGRRMTFFRSTIWAVQGSIII